MRVSLFLPHKINSHCTNRGSLRVTPEEYAVTTLALCPDIILSLSDASSPNTGNTVKRGQRAVDRTLKALDVLLSTLQNETLEDCQSPVVLAALVGGNNPTLRTKCAVESLKRHGIGGVVVPLVATDSLPLQIRLESSLSHVPKHMVRVVLGCETLMDVIDGVACGGDVFDGVYADTVTSSGHALIVTFPVGLNEAVSPVLDLRDGKYSQDMTPLSHSCPCSTCHRHSKAYIHHILNVKEMLAGVLLMAHNLTTVDCVMRNVRESLKSGTFDRDREAFRRVYYSAS